MSFPFAQECYERHVTYGDSSATIKYGTIAIKDLFIRNSRNFVCDIPNNEIYRVIMSGKINLDPCYSRSCRMSNEQQEQIINSVLAGVPIGTIYLLENRAIYEVLDGKQRLEALIKYMHKNISIERTGVRYKYDELTKINKKEAFDSYLLSLAVVTVEYGDIAVIQSHLQNDLNIQSIPFEAIEKQVMEYPNEWLAYMKEYFKKDDDRKVYQLSKGMLPWENTEKTLGIVLCWLSKGDAEKDITRGIGNKQRADIVKEYSAKMIKENRNSGIAEAKKCREQFEDIINWAQAVFPWAKDEDDAKNVDWGYLYYHYKDDFVVRKDNDGIYKPVNFDSNVLKREYKELLSTITPNIRLQELYKSILSGEPPKGIRFFSHNDKYKKWLEQDGICPDCHAEGNDHQYKFSEMEGDHIVAHANNGKTLPENLAMLCAKHNRLKADK